MIAEVAAAYALFAADLREVYAQGTLKRSDFERMTRDFIYNARVGNPTGQALFVDAGATYPARQGVYRDVLRIIFISFHRQEPNLDNVGEPTYSYAGIRKVLNELWNHLSAHPIVIHTFSVNNKLRSNQITFLKYKRRADHNWQLLEPRVAMARVATLGKDHPELDSMTWLFPWGARLSDLIEEVRATVGAGNEGGIPVVGWFGKTEAQQQAKLMDDIREHVMSEAANLNKKGSVAARWIGYSLSCEWSITPGSDTAAEQIINRVENIIYDFIATSKPAASPHYDVVSAIANEVIAWSRGDAVAFRTYLGNPSDVDLQQSIQMEPKEMQRLAERVFHAANPADLATKILAATPSVVYQAPDAPGVQEFETPDDDAHELLPPPDEEEEEEEEEQEEQKQEVQADLPIATEEERAQAITTVTADAFQFLEIDPNDEAAINEIYEWCDDHQIRNGQAMDTTLRNLGRPEGSAADYADLIIEYLHIKNDQLNKPTTVKSQADATRQATSLKDAIPDEVFASEQEMTAWLRQAPITTPYVRALVHYLVGNAAGDEFALLGRWIINKARVDKVQGGGDEEEEKPKKKKAPKQVLPSAVGQVKPLVYNAWFKHNDAGGAAPRAVALKQYYEAGGQLTREEAEQMARWIVLGTDEQKPLNRGLGVLTIDTMRHLARELGISRAMMDDDATKKDIEEAIRRVVGLPAAPKKKQAVQAKIGAHHPFNAQIHNTLQPLAGSYPSYYNVMHTKQDMTAEAPYAGDLLTTYRKYCAFAGVPLVPETPKAIPERPPTKPYIGAGAPALVPALIECGSCGKKDKKKSSAVQSEAKDSGDSVDFHHGGRYLTKRAEQDANAAIGCNGAPPRKGTQSRKPRTTHTMGAPIAVVVKKKLPEFGDIFK